MLIIINVYKWDEENIIKQIKYIKEEEEDFHRFITIEFILEKNTQKGTGVVSKLLAPLLQNVGDIFGL